MTSALEKKRLEEGEEGDSLSARSAVHHIRPTAGDETFSSDRLQSRDAELASSLLPGTSLNQTSSGATNAAVVEAQQVVGHDRDAKPISHRESRLQQLSVESYDHIDGGRSLSSARENALDTTPGAVHVPGIGINPSLSRRIRNNQEWARDPIASFQVSSSTLTNGGTTTVDSQDTLIQAELAPNIEEELEQRVQAAVQAERQTFVRASVLSAGSLFSKATTVDVDHSPWCNRTCCVIPCVVLVATGAALGITLGIGRAEQPTPTMSPEFSATERFELFCEFLSPIVAEEDPQILRDPTTNQFAALDWLANQDAWLATEKEKEGDETITDSSFLARVPPFMWVERYVLALLWFSTTTGPDQAWDQTFRFLEPISICDWALDDDETLDNISFHDFGGGVVCDDSMHAAALGLPVGGNGLKGTIPSEVGLLTHLVSLAISENSITGTLPTQLGLLTDLVFLALCGNRLSGSIPTEYGRLSDLAEILMDRNSLEGWIPAELGLLTLLEGLYLESNQFAGPIPSELGQCTNLSQLWLESNQLTGMIPSQLGLLTDMRTLNLGGNLLSGPIPTSLGEMTVLTLLLLFSNPLTGTIPTEVGRLTRLTELDVTRGELEGSIPSELVDLANLNYMYLGFNRLTGTIPSALGQMTNLICLALWSNQFSGTIPSELGLMTRADFLYLENNRLEGTVPSELLGMRLQFEVDISKNMLTGSVDEAFCVNRTGPPEDGVSADCLGSDPEIVCTCCTRCCDRRDACLDV